MQKSMEEEIEAIEKSQTWKLVNLLKWIYAIGVKWIYKTTFNVDGNVVKKKEMIVTKVFTQQHGTNYNETCAIVARLYMMRSFLAIIAHLKLIDYQMCTKSIFFNGIL